MEQSELIHTAIRMNESHGDDESETQDALEDHICERRWVSAIEVAQRAAPRWPQSTEIAVARVAALAGTGLRLAAAEAFAALDALDQASLEDIVEAGAAIEGQARESQDEEAMVAALQSHGVEVPDAALTHCATGAAHRRIDETPIAHLSAARWADAMNRAGMHRGGPAGAPVLRSHPATPRARCARARGAGKRNARKPNVRWRDRGL